MGNEQDKKLLTPHKVAEILGVGAETLNVWRATKRYNLPYIKIGSRVRYKKSDVAKFINSRTCNNAHLISSP